MQKNLNCKWINVDVCRILVEPTQDDQEGQNNGGFEPLLLSTGNLLLKRTIARMYISYSFDIETGVSRLHKSLPLVGQGLISCMDY